MANEAGWFLPWHCVNQLQVDSIERLLAAAKRAHYINVVVRINGQDVIYEADWIKSLEKGEGHVR